MRAFLPKPQALKYIFERSKKALREKKIVSLSSESLEAEERGRQTSASHQIFKNSVDQHKKITLVHLQINFYFQKSQLGGFNSRWFTFFAYALFFSKNTFSALLPKKSENSSQSVGEKQRSGLDVRENESTWISQRRRRSESINYQ